MGDTVGVSGSFSHQDRRADAQGRAVKLITKSMRPLPEKYHGLKDVEMRYRQRYVDLIVTPRTAEIFRKAHRHHPRAWRFLDATASSRSRRPPLRPSRAGHGQALRDLPQRPAHEAVHAHRARAVPKRLVVGGFEKVYEIGRQFRNEGIDTQQQSGIHHV